MWDAYPSKVVENLRDIVKDMKAPAMLNLVVTACRGDR